MSYNYDSMNDSSSLETSGFLSRMQSDVAKREEQKKINELKKTGEDVLHARAAFSACLIGRCRRRKEDSQTAGIHERSKEDSLAVRARKEHGPGPDPAAAARHGRGRNKPSTQGKRRHHMTGLLGEGKREGRRRGPDRS
eukprot:763526-Hanusia_phi.AAC.2